MERDATRRALAETVDVLVTDGAVAGVEAHGVETCAHGEGRKREVGVGDNFRVSIDRGVRKKEEADEREKKKKSSQKRGAGGVCGAA